MHVKAIHDKIKDIMCDQCDYKCSSLTVLYQHRNRVTPMIIWEQLITLAWYQVPAKSSCQNYR
jgi:hypothetical protein